MNFDESVMSLFNITAPTQASDTDSFSDLSEHFGSKLLARTQRDATTRCWGHDMFPHYWILLGDILQIMSDLDKLHED